MWLQKWLIDLEYVMFNIKAIILQMNKKKNFFFFWKLVKWFWYFQKKLRWLKIISLYLMSDREHNFT